MKNNNVNCILIFELIGRANVDKYWKPHCVNNEVMSDGTLIFVNYFVLTTVILCLILLIIILDWIVKHNLLKEWRDETIGHFVTNKD